MLSYLLMPPTHFFAYCLKDIPKGRLSPWGTTDSPGGVSGAAPGPQKGGREGPPVDAGAESVAAAAAAAVADARAAEAAEAAVEAAAGKSIAPHVPLVVPGADSSSDAKEQGVAQSVTPEVQLQASAATDPPSIRRTSSLSSTPEQIPLQLSGSMAEGTSQGGSKDVSRPQSKQDGRVELQEDLEPEEAGAPMTEDSGGNGSEDSGMCHSEGITPSPSPPQRALSPTNHPGLLESEFYLLDEEGVSAPPRSPQTLPPLHRPSPLMVQAVSLSHQLSPRVAAGRGGVLLAPLAPSSSLTFDSFAAEQHSRVLEATRAHDSASSSAIHLLPSVGDDPALRAAMTRTPNTRLMLSIMQAEAYAQDYSEMVRPHSMVSASLLLKMFSQL